MDNKQNEQNEQAGMEHADMPSTHESYGLAQFSRVSGTPGKLFGSNIQHNHFIELTISRASRYRDYQCDRYMPEKEIVSVAMSPSQFAELLTSMNIGAGVPVTIQHVEQKKMAACPASSFVEQTHADMKQEFKRLATRLETLSQSTKELLSGPGQLKASDKKKIESDLNMVLQEIRDNIPFIHTCFQEACDRTVQDAKAVVDNTVLHAQIQLGKEACERLGLQGTSKGLLE